MATLTFRVGDHIFLICYLINHMIFFWDFRSKLFGNILKIDAISCSKFFKLIFLKSLAENIGNEYFNYIKIYIGQTKRCLQIRIGEHLVSFLISKVAVTINKKLANML
jgi:hypothetical protein